MKCYHPDRVLVAYQPASYYVFEVCKDCKKVTERMKSSSLSSSASVIYHDEAVKNGYVGTRK